MVKEGESRQSGVRFLLGSASLVIIVFGMREIQSLLVPILLAAFGAVILSSPKRWLQSKGLNEGLSIVVVLFLALGALMAFIGLLGDAVGEFNTKAPQYQERAQKIWQDIGGALPVDASNELAGSFDPAQIVDLLAATLNGLTSTLTMFFLVLFMMMLMLAETTSFEEKFSSFREDTKNAIVDLIGGIRSYLALKTAVSLATGAAVWLLTWSLEIDFPILWALIAFALNFIPNIGSIIAAVPAVLVAYIQLGFEVAGLVALGYLAINMIVGNIIEPKIMGKGMGLSVLVVFVSMIFWGWVLGPVGFLLSVPLTLALKLILDLYPGSKPYAKLLS